jgi:hypothetical protein
MMLASLRRRLDQLAARLPAAPAELPEQLRWIEWTANSELDRLEAIYRAAVDEDRQLTEPELLEALSNEAMALKRRLEGWPTHHEDGERYRALERAP